MVYINLKMAETTVFHNSAAEMGVAKIAARFARHFVFSTLLLKIMMCGYHVIQ